MRLWTVHPKYLDAKGLVAHWREALLAKAVLTGTVKGYRNHPQLVRFNESGNPKAYINNYLHAIFNESLERGYRFDSSKVGQVKELPPLPETSGQLEYEWGHLRKKLISRSPEVYEKIKDVPWPDCHPIFRIVEGAVRDWEKVKP